MPIASRGESAPAVEEPDPDEEHARWLEEEHRREALEAQEAEEEKGLLKAVIPVAIGLLAIATVLAATYFDWRLVALGGLLIFCYMLLIGGPIWMAALEEKVESEHERVTGEEAESIH